MSATAKPWRETPLIESANLSKAAGCRILLKLDNLQPSGSFKSRGIGGFCSHALSASPHPDRVHFYSSSGGNAGLACVFAAKALGRPATVVVPTSTKAMMVEKLKAAGAREVVQMGASWREADGYLRDVVMKHAVGEGVYVHPFDHEVTWQGHSSLVDEIADVEPDVVVCSVGGGGLFNGVVQGLERHGVGAKTTVLAMETKGADSLDQALKAGELVMLPGITSQATSLGATRVCERTFELAREGVRKGTVRNAVLSDAEAAMGCWRFADDERMLVELACGVSVAVCYGGRLEKALGRPVRKEEKVVIVVCGGSNVTTQMMEGWRSEFGDVDAGESNRVVVPSSVTAPNSVH